MLGKIINNELKLNSYYIGNTHTSCFNQKYSFGIKKLMNDTIFDSYNTGFFKGTLNPTSPKYTCSFSYPQKYACDYNMTNITFHNKPNDVRIGDQKEIMKSDHVINNLLIKNNHAYKKNIFISTEDNSLLYANNEAFRDSLKKDNISFNKEDLHVMSSQSEINKKLPEMNKSFSSVVSTKVPRNIVEVVHDACDKNAGLDPTIRNINIISTNKEACSVIHKFQLNNFINDSPSSIDIETNIQDHENE